MRIVFAIILNILVNSIPALFISFLIRVILKRKLSKGWCISVFILSTLLTSIVIGILSGFYNIGIIGFIVQASIIFGILYDKELPSLFDGEKEQKRKYHLRHNKTECKEKDNYTVAISILEEYANNFNSNLFNTEIEVKIKTFLTNDKNVLNNNKFYNDELMVRGLIAGMIGNYAGDLLESGKFHLYRGVLSSAGKEMLKYYDFSMKEVLKIGGTNPNGKPLTGEYITEQRNILLENIRQVG